MFCMFGFFLSPSRFFRLSFTHQWMTAAVPREALPWLHHPFHCILVTISLCGPLWSGSCSLPLLRLLINPFPEELGRNFISHIVAVWWQHLSKQHCLEQSWKSASVLCSSLFASLQALISFSCLQFCALFLLCCWPHTSSLLMPSVICACSAVCWNSSPSILPFHWKIFEECWWSCSLLVNDEVCRGES